MLYKKLFVFIFAFLLASCAPVTKPTEAPKLSPAELGKAATVAFVMESMNSKMPTPPTFAYCSGVWINSDTLLTALHCAKGAARMAEIRQLPKEIQPFATFFVPDVEDPTGTIMEYIVENEVTGLDTPPKTKHNAKVIAIDPTHDLAILHGMHAQMPEHIWLPVANLIPKVGDKVYIIGHPGGLYFTFFDGMVSAIRPEMPHRPSDELYVEGPFLQIFSGIYKGNSGGPIVSEKGEIVGIASFIAAAPNQGFAIASPAIKHFIIETHYKHLL